MSFGQYPVRDIDDLEAGNGGLPLGLDWPFQDLRACGPKAGSGKRTRHSCAVIDAEGNNVDALIARDVGLETTPISRIGHADELEIAAPEHGAVIARANERAIGPRLRRRQSMVTAVGQLEAEAAIPRSGIIEIGDGDPEVVQRKLGHRRLSPPIGSSPIVD